MVYTQAPILLNCLSYDGIGRLIGKNIGGSVVNNTLTFAENLTMSYNPRNWLTSINGKSAKNDAFNYSLQYTEAGQFNGNIGKMIVNNQATTYNYDGINRLRLAEGLDAAGKQMKEQISYDLNGNILSLNRTMGGLEIDRLSYAYKANSNQLQAVTDNIAAHNGLGYYDGNKTATNFTYDNNGSMTSDLDKSLTLTYNRLNLVQTAQINTSKQVYLYNTQGNKMAQKVGGQIKAYLFGSEYVKEYVKEELKEELSRMQTAEGFVSKNLNWKDGSTEKKYPYSFTISDHFGNTRLVVDAQGQVQQKNEYTAFGVVQSTDPSKNKYLFNNKELQTGTNYLDYGARMYQPELGRWNVVDPLAHLRISVSPYNYVQNNPISRVDPNGAIDDYFIRKDGDIVVNKTNDSFDRFYTEKSQKTEGDMVIRSYSLAAKLEKNDQGLVNFPASGEGFSRYGGVEQGGLSSGVKKGVAFTEEVGSGDHYLKSTTAAALFGVVNELNGKGIAISFGDMSSSYGSDPANAGRNTFHHAGHGHLGKRLGLDADYRYIGQDGKSYQGVMRDSRFSVKNNTEVYEAATRFGFDPANTYQGTTGTVPGVKTMGGHNNHGHLGFKQNPTNFIPYVPYNQQ